MKLENNYVKVDKGKIGTFDKHCPDKSHADSKLKASQPILALECTMLAPLLHLTC